MIVKNNEISGIYIDDDIESTVKRYMKHLKNAVGEIYKPNKKKYKRVKIPTFKDDMERVMWEREEIRRCKEGYDGMCGKNYFYFNYCKIKSIEGGMIRPEWRRISRDHFDLIESCLRGDNKGKGMNVVKRRRIGFSWEESASILHEAMFYPYTEIGMQSKSERDIQILFNNKLKFVYDNLPLFLKASSDAGNSLMKMDFSIKSRDEKGNPIKVGTQSMIICKSPTDTNWEGVGLKIWFSDEAGKTSNVKNILSLTLPCLAGDDGITRHGVPILGGTAGDIDEVGSDFKDIWYGSDSYDLIRFFIPGWAGLKLDEKGNEDVEKAVRWILAERKKRRHLTEKEYYDFLQQYPLSPEEAFMSGTASPFDIITIQKRLTDLSKNPAKIQTGIFQWDDEEKHTVIFRGRREGKVQIFEHPVKNVDNLYVAGADPYDHAKEANSGSEGSMFIYKRLYDVDEYANMPIFQYTDQPTDPNIFYEQCLMACIYYNCKVLIEKNRTRMIGYFTDKGFNQYLKEKPQKVNKMLVRNLYEYGIYMDEDNKRFMIGGVDDYIRHNCDSIYFEDLLEDMLIYDPDNQKKKKDRVDAFGITLIYARDRAIRDVRKEGINDRLPKFSYRKVGGKLRRINTR